MRSRILMALLFWLVTPFLSTSESVLLLAQDTDAYEEFDVLILPDYEYPGVEIRIEGVVRPGEYPRYLELGIPYDTEAAILSKPDSQGNPVSVLVEAREADGRFYLPVDVSESRFLLYYYFSPFDSNSVERSFTYELVTNEALYDLHVILQEPIGARNLRHTFAAAEELVGEFGLVYYQQHISELLPGTSFIVDVSYENPTRALTLAELQTRMEQRLAESGADPETSSEFSLGLGTVLAVTLLAGTVMYTLLRLGYRRKSTVSATAPRENRQPDSKAESSVTSPMEKNYCSRCGARRRPQSRFCSNCGEEF